MSGRAAVDARSTPQCVLSGQAQNQNSEFLADPGPPSNRGTPPAPECSESKSVPPHQRLRLDDSNGVDDDRCYPRQPRQEDPVQLPQYNPAAMLTLENQGLVSAARRRCDLKTDAITKSKIWKDSVIPFRLPRDPYGFQAG